MYSLTTVLVAVLGSSVIAALITSRHNNRQHRKEVVAGATRSALKRVEMYYRIRRRSPTGSDDTELRDQFHDIQEENDYYTSLLTIEAPWLGFAYQRFLASLKNKLKPKIIKAWNEKGQGPRAEITDGIDLQKQIDLFTKDSRRLFNPIMRPLRRLAYMARKLFKENPYES